LLLAGGKQAMRTSPILKRYDCKDRIYPVSTIKIGDVEIATKKIKRGLYEKYTVDYNIFAIDYLFSDRSRTSRG
jgi:hypothetical protein